MNRSWHFQMQQHRQERGLDSLYNTNNTSPPSAMDPTTLVTFHFKAPPDTRSVELLGSWDNFRQPYLMHRDSRRGRRYWTGCFVFRSVIFDGDGPSWAKPRDGGLKQGGTYWFFYRLNDDVEAFDDSMLHDSSCPLLPGQRLNVIEVPIEIPDPPTRCVSAYGNAAEELARTSSVQTLDPSDKFAVLRPPPISRVHGRCVSDLALSGRLESTPRSPALPSSDPPPAQYCTVSVPGHEHHSNRPTSFGSGYASPDQAASRHSSFLDFQYPPPVDSSELSPVLESPRQPLRPSARVSYEEDVPSEFRPSDPFLDFDTLSHANATTYSSHSITSSRPSTSRSRSRHRSSRWRTAFSRSPSRSFRSHLHRDRSHDLEHDHFGDILSPTFSAATLSSAGLNTPYRLSSTSSTSHSVPAQSNQEQAGLPNENSISDLSNRLSRLGNNESTRHLESSSYPYQLPEPALSTYSLPPATEEAKPAVTHKRGWSLLLNRFANFRRSEDGGTASDGSPPALTGATMEREDQGDSFAEDVFSELGIVSS